MIRGLKAVARNRARLERDRIIYSSMMRDMDLGEAMLESSCDYFLEDGDQFDDEELDKLIEMIPVSNIDDTEEEQINKIMDSNDSMEVDDLLAINDAISEEE